MTDTGDKKFVMSYSRLVPMVIAMLIGTNTVSLLVYNQAKNTEDIEYNDIANKRRLKNALFTLKLEQDNEKLREIIKKCK